MVQTLPEFFDREINGKNLWGWFHEANDGKDVGKPIRVTPLNNGYYIVSFSSKEEYKPGSKTMSVAVGAHYPESLSSFAGDHRT